MFEFSIFYGAIVIIVFVINLIRYIRCARYQHIYNENFNNNTPLKNFRIKPFLLPLLDKGKVVLLNTNIDVIANKSYIEDFNKAFENAKGHFYYLMCLSLIWPWLVIKTFKMFAPIRKITNKVAWVILAPLEMFLAYLLGIFLDTTGIGDKILKFLLDFLSRIFPNIN